MSLTDLDPRWYTFAHAAEGVVMRIGLTFLCPHCREQRLAVPFYPPIDPEGLIEKFGIRFAETGHIWRREGDTFETLTLTPSIDASVAATIEFPGHWHGHITNGEIC